MNDAIEKFLENELKDSDQIERFKSKLGELGLIKLLESGEEDKTDSAIELHSLEYEKAVERYENIYKAVWQNFSYMSIVAGGILTFGSSVLGDYTLTAFLSCIPLLFWYVVTFVPMNGYGYKASDQLAEIENKLNSLAGTDLNHFRNFKERRKKRIDILRKPSVRFSMLCSFIVLFFVAGYFFANAFLSDTILFKKSNFHQIKDVIISLKPASQENTAILGIRQKLSASTIREVERYDRSLPLPLDLQKRVIEDFNRLMEGPLLSGTCTDCRLEDIKKNNRKYLQTIFPDNIPDVDVSNFNNRIAYWLPPIVGVLALITAGLFVYFEWQAIWRDAAPLKSLQLLACDFSNGAYRVKLMKIQSEVDLDKLKNQKFFKLPKVDAEEWTTLDNSLEVIAFEDASNGMTSNLITFEQVKRMVKENSDKSKKKQS
jgi:hypothetical protein